MPATLKNSDPFSSPASMARVAPAAAISRAAAGTERQPEIAREAVSRSGADHRKRHLRSGQCRTRAVDGAVTSPRDDEVMAGVPGFGGKAMRIGRACRDADLCVEAMARQHRPGEVRTGANRRGAAGAGDGIDDDGRAQRRHLPASARRARGGRNQRSVPGPPGVALSTSIRQIAPFLNSTPPRAPNSRAVNSPRSGCGRRAQDADGAWRSP